MQIQSIYARYISGLKPDSEYDGDSVWFVFDAGKLLVMVFEDHVSIPCCKSLEGLGMALKRSVYLGTFDSKPCYAVEADSSGAAPDGMEFRVLRSLFEQIDEDEFLLAGRALQILYWHQTHKFCGRCGSETKDKSDERAKICEKCGLVTYPRISPAIIVAVVKDGQILLAHAKHFPKNMYSVIAGFVEPGETFEDCVNREVKEEVGIAVKNLKYFGSQPWPFPDSLMVAFTAEYESGEILVDGVEIADAGWYTKDKLPETPSRMSIGGRLINWFKEIY